MVEPVDPLECCELDRLEASPWASRSNHLRLVQPDDGLGQVVRIAHAPNRLFDAGLGQTFGVADGEILRPAVAVVDQGVARAYRALVQRLLERVECQVGAQRVRHPPAGTVQLPGFGVRVYPSGAKVYIVQTYLGGKSKRTTLGRHGLITADQARRKAALTIARTKHGEDTELATSGWVVDPARAQYRRAAAEGTAGTLHEKVLSRLVRPYDRPVMNNVRRGEYILCLVAELLGTDWTPPWTRDYDWAPWNLEHVSGAKIEVRQYASLQPEDPGTAAWSKDPAFNISARKGYWTLDGSWIDQFDRPADIYVLAWHPERDRSVVDHREPEQWRFFVIPTSIFRARETVIGLAGLEELTKAIGYESLAGAVQETLDGL